VIETIKIDEVLNYLEDCAPLLDLLANELNIVCEERNLLLIVTILTNLIEIGIEISWKMNKKNQISETIRNHEQLMSSISEASDKFSGKSSQKINSLIDLIIEK
jgi:hypothetical protein